ncbi:MAG: hypothetical protein WDO69_20775 [Pseudomonadota bacterium]
MTATALLILLSTGRSFAQVGNYASRAAPGRSIVITGAAGESIRITPYGDYVVRVQVIRKGESFHADDRCEIVETHDWPGVLSTESDSALSIATAAADGISLSVTKNPIRLSVAIKTANTPMLSEKDGTTWSGNTVTEAFGAASALPPARAKARTPVAPVASATRACLREAGQSSAC